ncbi:MAG: 50S ribosomal protein L4 [Candidatus Sulcia muelleri]|uniref:Large ribosomal subunit protein uL4 n=1 Tax=Karelsulcia muelleri (strain GWSS) TaxID=444179 RepID=A8Z669_KARMG|nr:50S ribosomal subunit protein L4 [Candidatus Karelsulcia muelleri GWSS]MCJ7422577.1 50S ribosomal protein L4 [Candidatus Karelsulcia muelleri]MCJ7468820.1 50S ribosomal protein L4 [Candidatus Karelsulcia muelleri]
MKITIFNNSGLETGRYLKVNNFFLKKENNNILFLDIKRYLSAQRQGTNKSKERSEITGSTKKIQRQKGSGNARKGDIKNPIFRSGGRIFGPKPRNFNIKINNKSKFLAKKTILNFKLRTNKIKVIEDFKFNIIKTKLVFKILNRLNFNFNIKKSLIIYNKINDIFFFSSRNLKFTNFLSINELNSYELANSDYLVFFESAIKKILKL